MRIATKGKDSSLADELQSRTLLTMCSKNDLFSRPSQNPAVPDGGKIRREENDFQNSQELAVGNASSYGASPYERAGRAALTNIDRVSHHVLADGKHGSNVRTF